MILNSNNLKNICYVNSNSDGDNFVGVKIKDNQAKIHFPLGYHLPLDERGLKKEIRLLLKILNLFTKKESYSINNKIFKKYDLTDFPILSFLDVIDYFIENNGKYYQIKESRYTRNSKGKIDFKRTVKKETPIFKNNSFLYTNFQVKYKSHLENVLITNINKFLVYIAFQNLYWLYPSQIIPKPGIIFNKRVFLEELKKYYRQINLDRDKRLFKSMITMVEFHDDRSVSQALQYGTDNFEFVWEKVIDKIFGISNKENYFPKANWFERNGNKSGTETHALMPDTIMIWKDKVYILDAKYYRYGTTHNPLQLPDTSSINKQITYGDYLNTKKGINEEFLFNAFLMPYNSQINLFEANSHFLNIAEAKGKWRKNNMHYEKIQGVLVDVKYLLLNHAGNHDNLKELLSLEIEKFLIDKVKS